MGKPSKGTPADKRLKANKRAASAGSSRGGAKTSAAFGGKRAAPFARGGGRKK